MCSGSVYFQFVQIPHKETPFLSCTIRVQSGRNRKTSSQDAMQAMKAARLRQKPGGAAPLKKHCPLLMRGNSQGSGQTTNHLLTAANVWEFSYTASAAFSSFPRRWLFLFIYGSNLSVTAVAVPASGLRLPASASLSSNCSSTFSLNRGRSITWIPICSIRYKTRAGLWSFFAAEAITLRVKAKILSFL